MTEQAKKHTVFCVIDEDARRYVWCAPGCPNA